VGGQPKMPIVLSIVYVLDYEYGRFSLSAQLVTFPGPHFSHQLWISLFGEFKSMLMQAILYFLNSQIHSANRQAPVAIEW
jgi:hypothetical protein